MSLTGAGVAKYHNANVYQECLYAPNSGLEETISRTLVARFQSTNNSELRVRPTLIVSSVACLQCLQPSGGYCQGMGYMCALLLCYLNEGCF